MEASEIILAVLTGLIAVVWTWMLRQQSRIDARLDRIETELAKKADRDEMNARFAQVQDQFAQVQDQFGQVHAQFGQVHAQFGQVHAQFGQVHAQFGDLRSDLTQIALAVGAQRPSDPER